MAEVFGSDSTVPAPALSGGYYPGADLRVIDGLGLAEPWGGGPLVRQMQEPIPIGTPSTSLNTLQALSLMLQAMPSGNTYNYNFEGLVGPPGPPGPIGATTVVFAKDLEGHMLNVPTRVLSDGATPGAPSGVTATAMTKAVMLEWTANTELDIDHYEVWRYTSNDSGSASKILETYGTLCVDGGVTAGQEYYYWVKAVDCLGNTSGFSSPDNATPGSIEDDIVEIDASKILLSGTTYLSDWRHASDVTKIDGGDIYASSITLTSAAADFDLGSITGDADDISEGATNKFAGESGADVTGSHTANDTSYVNGLASSSVSGWAKSGATTYIDGGKIYTGTVTASQIYANTITASEIAAGTITYTELKATAGSEAVDTGVIRDAATGVTETAHTAGSVSLGSSPTTIQTLSSVNAEGYPIELIGSFNVYNGDIVAHTNPVYFYEGTNLLATRYTPSVPASSTISCTITYSYTPSSGSKTYYLKATRVHVNDTASERTYTLKSSTGK